MFATITNAHAWDHDDGVQPFLVVNSARDEILLYESRYHPKVCVLVLAEVLVAGTNI